jgi:oligoendopeptidase F
MAIRINPANKGKLRKAAGAKKGQNIPESELQKLKKSTNPAVRKRAQFAINAKKWKH